MTRLYTENWLSIAAGVYLLGMVLYGHHRGFIRLVVSMLAVVLSLTIVRASLPSVTGFLKENTGLQQTISENMKKSICAKDIEQLILKGEKVFYIDGSEIITPSAKDLAKNNEILFTTEVPAPKVETLEAKKVPSIEGMDSEMMLNFFRAMMDKGLLQEMLECLKPKNLLFEAELFLMLLPNLLLLLD